MAYDSDRFTDAQYGSALGYTAAEQQKAYTQKAQAADIAQRQELWQGIRGNGLTDAPYFASLGTPVKQDGIQQQMGAVHAELLEVLDGLNRLNDALAGPRPTSGQNGLKSAESPSFASAITAVRNLAGEIRQAVADARKTLGC